MGGVWDRMAGVGRGVECRGAVRVQVGCVGGWVWGLGRCWGVVRWWGVA